MKDEDKTKAQLIGELAEFRRKVAELELINHGLFMSMPAMLVKLRNENGILVVEACNRLFLETLGYTFEEVENRPLVDFYTPKSKALFRKDFQPITYKDGKYESERELVARDGSVVDIIIRITQRTVIFLDITEHKQAEEALQAKTREARLLAEMLDDSSLPFAVGTPDGRLSSRHHFIRALWHKDLRGQKRQFGGLLALL